MWFYLRWLRNRWIATIHTGRKWPPDRQIMLTARSLLMWQESVPLIRRAGRIYEHRKGQCVERLRMRSCIILKTNEILRVRLKKQKNHYKFALKRCFQIYIFLIFFSHRCLREYGRGVFAGTGHKVALSVVHSCCVAFHAGETQTTKRIQSKSHWTITEQVG